MLWSPEGNVDTSPESSTTAISPPRSSVLKQSSTLNLVKSEVCHDTLKEKSIYSSANSHSKGLVEKRTASPNHSPGSPPSTLLKDTKSKSGDIAARNGGCNNLGNLLGSYLGNKQ